MTRRITFTNICKSELFDIYKQCALHLLIQNKQSVNEDGMCRYRSSEGTSCAIGCFITDSQYKRIQFKIEGDSIWSVSQRYLMDKGLTSAQRDLLTRLQCIHDNKEPEQWLDNFIDLGTRYRFNFDFLSVIPTIDMTKVEEIAQSYLTQYTKWGGSYFLPRDS
jgi:hypothetical protein